MFTSPQILEVFSPRDLAKFKRSLRVLGFRAWTFSFEPGASLAIAAIAEVAVAPDPITRLVSIGVKVRSRTAW